MTTQKLITVSTVGLLLALGAGGAMAAPDWGKAPGKKITVFYPGVSPIEWITKGSEHGGAKALVDAKGEKKGDEWVVTFTRKLAGGGEGDIAMAAGKTYNFGFAIHDDHDYKYDPPEIKVKVGTAVKWINLEKRASHSILFTGPGGFGSDRIFPGESWQRVFDRPGSYPYTCGPHPEMKGRIEVSE